MSKRRGSGGGFVLAGVALGALLAGPAAFALTTLTPSLAWGKPGPIEDVRVMRVEVSSEGAVAIRLVVPRDLAGPPLSGGAVKVSGGDGQLPVDVTRLEPNGWDVGIVLDAGRAGGDAEKAELRAAAGDLVAALPTGTRMSLFTAGSPDRPAHWVTEDRRSMSRAVDRSDQLSGRADAWARLVKESTHRTGSQRPAVAVLFSSAETPSQATDLVRGLVDDGVPLYALWAGRGSVPPVLRDSARGTGGLLAAAEGGRLTEEVDRVVADLGDQYVVHTQLPPGTGSRLHLTVRGDGGDDAVDVELPARTEPETASPTSGPLGEVSLREGEGKSQRAAGDAGGRGWLDGPMMRALLASVALLGVVSWAVLALGPPLRAAGRHRRDRA